MSRPSCFVCDDACDTVGRFYVITPAASELRLCSAQCVLRWAVVVADVAAAGQPGYIPVEIPQDLRQWAWAANLPRASA